MTKQEMIQEAKKLIGDLPRKKLEDAYAEYWADQSGIEDEERDELESVFRNIAHTMQLWILIHAVKQAMVDIDTVQDGEVWYCPRGCHTVTPGYTDLDSALSEQEEANDESSMS